ncbi:IS110 family transposase, partial [Mammaliicoccus sciuri]|nr:IS110 family transposase [Mammaliicoccus sciuri]
DLVSQKDIESLTSSIMEYTNKNLSYQKAQNYAERLNKIAQESYPNVKHSSFLVKKVRLLIQQLKSSIQQLSQLDKEMIELAQQL